MTYFTFAQWYPFKKDTFSFFRRFYMAGEKNDNLTITYGDGILYVTVYGEIDHHSVREIRESIDRAVFLYQAKDVKLDLAHVDFMDSSGLGLILGRHTKVKELGGVLTVCNPTKRIEQILSMAGTDKLISIVHLAKK